MTTKKINDDAIATFSPMIEQMAGEGCDTDQIVHAFHNQVRVKTAAFYRNPDFIPLNKLVKTIIESPPDSKAESILLAILSKNGIDCVFHRKIGPYEADFIVNDNVILELDGPEHNKISNGVHDTRRDEYLKRMGYHVVRIPIWALSLNTDAIIDEIKEMTVKKEVRKKKSKKSG